MTSAEIVTGEAPELLLLTDPLPAGVSPPARATETLPGHRVTLPAVETVALEGAVLAVVPLLTLLLTLHHNNALTVNGATMQKTLPPRVNTEELHTGSYVRIQHK